VPYRFATDARSYEPFASGHVLRSRPGQAAFPVRLGRELFEQARALRNAANLTLYDPCCGAAHLTTTLGLLYAPSKIIASDIDETVLPLARQNLHLVEPRGLQERIAELESIYRREGNPAHAAALESARMLAAQPRAPIEVRCFKADAQDPKQLDVIPDIIVIDPPYGRLSRLHGSLTKIIDALATILPPGGVLAIATGGEKIHHARLTRARQLKVGHRRLTWLVR
jgi:23S rRNA (guanine2535-N1)-methyltransferase